MSLVTNNASTAVGKVVWLSWSSSDAWSCQATGDWRGSLPSAGGQNSPILTAARTYEFWILCEGANGQRAQDSVRVQVGSQAPAAPAPPAADMTLAASPSSVALGQTSIISWNLPGARSCQASGDWSGSRANSGELRTGALTSSKRYQYWMRCTAADGSRLERVAYVQAGGSSAPASPPNPSGLTLTASADSVSRGNPVTLSWSSPAGSSCRASGDWSGSYAASGSLATPPLTEAKRYQFWLICNGSAGRFEDVAYVGTDGTLNKSVAPPPGEFQFTSSASTIAAGERVTLRWTVPGATSCRSSGDWTGNRSASGTLTTAPLRASREHQFWLLCNGASGRQEGVAKVVVGTSTAPSSGAPQVTFSASRSRVRDGELVTLNWNAPGASSCTGSGAWSGNLGISGSRQVRASLSNRSYSMSCRNAAGASLEMISLDVFQLVKLAWAAPTLNEDGSPVGALAGYNVKYGTRSGTYTTTRFISGRTNTRLAIELPAGTYYFAVSALNEARVESRNSGEAVKTVR